MLFLAIEMFDTRWAVSRARRQPERAADYLRRTVAYWDELTPLRQPFLKPLLVIVGEQDQDELLEAVAHLSANTPQRSIAAEALVESAEASLLRAKALEEIARVKDGLEWLSSFERDDLTEVPDWLENEYTLHHEGEARRSSRRSRPLIKADEFKGLRQCWQISVEIDAALSATSTFLRLRGLELTLGRLSSLQNFAVMSRDRRAQVFTRVARQWRGAVEAEITRVVKGESATGSIPNPYIAPRPLLPTDNFFGRSEVFEFVEEHFLRGGQNVPIVLHGQPRIGKSSVLRHFTRALPTDLIPVYVDMQRSAMVESTGALLFNLADAIEQEFARRSLPVRACSLGDYASEPFIVFGKFLDSVEQVLRARNSRMILALDEFEEIERKLSDGKISLDIMPFLRNMMQHRSDIGLLFAGTHSLDEMIRDYWIPYFRSAVPFEIGYLDEAAALKLITSPIENFPLKYDPKAVRLLVQKTNRHPCLIQLTCSALVDAKNRQRSQRASVDDVKQALDAAVKTGDYVFRGVWEWIPSEEREMLDALAKRGKATADELARAAQLTPEQVRRMSHRLTEVEVLSSTLTNGQLSYAFQVDLFRQWVAQHSE